MKVPSKRIISSFIAGSIVGAAITAAVFYSFFALQDHEKGKTYAFGVEQNEQKEDDIQQKEINPPTESVKTSSKIKKEVIAKPEKEVIDTNEVVAELKDSVILNLAIDSLPKDSAFITEVMEEDSSDTEIVIKKEKLLRTISVMLIDVLKVKKEETEKNDSLIEKVSGIKKTPTSLKYTIEYWESPVNFKGYKMANNKLVVYGIDPLPKATLYRFNEKIYLLHNGICYQLDNTFAFKPFSSIKDETIIAQFQ